MNFIIENLFPKATLTDVCRKHPHFTPQMCIENENGHDLRFRPLCCFLESGDALEMTERNIWSNFCHLLISYL
jgi:hypothetical protein